MTILLEHLIRLSLSFLYKPYVDAFTWAFSYSALLFYTLDLFQTLECILLKSRDCFSSTFVQTQLFNPHSNSGEDETEG